jgi:DNA mismatch repair protein MutS
MARLDKVDMRVGEELGARLGQDANEGIAERIRSLNLDELRPIEALQLLSELQRELKHQ